MLNLAPNDLNIVTIIQTRMGSSRLPGKVMLPLAGSPLFIQQVRRVQAASLCGTVVVATTADAADDIIEETCNMHNVLCYRGHATDLLDRHYHAARLYNAHAVVKIPSDCPLIDPAVIDRVIGYYCQHVHLYHYVSNLHPATYPDGNDVEIMHFTTLESAWKNASRPLEREHTTPYIWEHPEKFNIGNVEMEAAVDYSMQYRFTIDYEEDYRFIRAVYEALYKQNPLFSVTDILALLHERKDIYAINQQWLGVNWYRHHLDELTTITPQQTKIPANEA